MAQTAQKSGKNLGKELIHLKNDQKKPALNAGSGMGIGIAIGAALGLLLNNLALGIGIGVAIGAGMGGVAGSKDKNDEKK